MILAVLVSAAALAQEPDVTAISALVMDADTGKVLWGKNSDLPSYPASTTKIMTGLLLLERVSPNEQIKAPSDVEQVTGSNLHLKPGETISAKDMLYALMVRSANDGAYAVAHHISGSVPAFSQLMNERALQLGCLNTNFNNPNGLNDDLHTTTAYDLALIAREAMKYPDFRDAAKTKVKKIARSVNQEDTVLVSKNKVLKSDPTADGIKTGYTRPAGYCYVGSATRNGYRVITVVLKSEDWKADTKLLLDWAFGNHERTLVSTAQEVVHELPVQGGAQPRVAVAPERDVYVTLPRNHRTDLNVIVDAAQVSAPIAAGQRVGEIVYTDIDGFEQRIPAVAVSDVPRQNLVQAAASMSPAHFLGGGALLGGVLWLRGNSRRKMRAYGRRRRSNRQRAY
jgi:D-alanyl-D-alanine carboxypeptidase (penicillin-binding protein 5/6)